jgi:hypothetical protein
MFFFPNLIAASAKAGPRPWSPVSGWISVGVCRVEVTPAGGSSSLRSRDSLPFRVGGGSSWVPSP